MTERAKMPERISTCVDCNGKLGNRRTYCTACYSKRQAENRRRRKKNINWITRYLRHHPIWGACRGKGD